MTLEEKIELIIDAVDYLLDADLQEENGWTKEKINFLNDASNKKINLSFEE